MKKVVHAFHVRFTRELDEDLEFARTNYPNVASEDQQLAAQCILEIEANPKFRGRCVAESVYRHGAQYDVLTAMTFKTTESDREQARLEFCRQLQRCYDVGGMAGAFTILD